MRCLDRDRTSKKALWAAIVLATCGIFFALMDKYGSFGYNAIDLGIYGQVFFNTAGGQLFEFTVHPHLYLGDHFELFILALVPFFAAVKSPLTLLFLQTAAVTLTAWPLYLIVRRWLPAGLSLAAAVSFLLCPFVLNMLFFEFHILTFAVPLLVFAFLFYTEKRFIPFTAFLLLSLLVREDVALVVVMFGVLALIDRRPMRWALVPIAAGILWFAAALQLTGYFNVSGSNKFLSFYSWLGETPGEIVKNFFLKPHLVLKQVISFNNILLAVGLLMPLIFLPILKLRYLIPVALTAGQLFLTGVSSTVILQTHYAALIVPFLYIAAAAGLGSIRGGAYKKRKLTSFFTKQQPIGYIILGAAILYSFVTFSPLIGSARALVHNGAAGEYRALCREFIDHIDGADRVVSSFSFLPHLSQRPELYSLHYAFLGKKQFSDEPYAIPDTADTLLIDFSDFIVYNIQSETITSYSEQYPTGSERIVRLIEERGFGIVKIIDDIALYRRGIQPAVTLYESVEQLPVNVRRTSNNASSPLSLVGMEPIEQDGSTTPYGLLPIALYWQVHGILTDDYQIELAIRDGSGNNVYEKLYQLGYGLYPTSSWENGSTVKTNHWFLIPREYSASSYHVSIQIVRIHGTMQLNGIRSAAISITERDEVGKPYELSY